jgi:hypothetical protein
MNYLKDTSVYLCGAMYGQNDCGIGWRETITPRLQQFGIKISDPTKTTANGVGEVGDDKKHFRSLIVQEKWDDLKEAFWPIVHKDLRAVDKADFVICNYNPKQPTVGTFHELLNANWQKKPIFLKYDKELLSDFNPWMCVFIKSGYFHNNWDSLFEHLSRIDQGDLDTSYWS